MCATLNGVRTFHTAQGTGPALICVHGGPGMSDHRGYARWLAPLADEDQLLLHDLRDRLGDIRVPRLVICGRHDWITPLDQSEYLAAHIPGARLAVFDRSGHGPMAGENEAFLAEVRRFLRS